MKEQSNFEIKNKITPTGHEFEAKAKVPQEAVTELVLATTRCIDSIRKGSERVGAMLSNSSKAIGKPIGAYLEGKSNEISANSQLIVANIMYKKEINAIKHLQYISEELNQKVAKGEDIPEKIEESDNLLLIQDNASTTSNEELLKMWAKLYTEEACKSGSVSRKAIKLVESLDLQTAKTIEEEIFPYCDNSGVYWGAENKYETIMLAVDYGFLQHINYEKKSMGTRNLNAEIISNYMLYVYPGFNYSPNPSYKLTAPALEIRSALNKSFSKDILNEISQRILKSTVAWHFDNEALPKAKLKKDIPSDEKFVICDMNNNVVYPINKTYKTIHEYGAFAIANLEFEEVQNDK